MEEQRERIRRVAVPAAVVALAVAALAGGWWYFSAYPGAGEQLLLDLGLRQPASQRPGLTASGFIEAEEIAIAAELGGRVTALPADEGAEVQPGDVLAELDRAVLEAELAVAQARLDAARAALARLKAGAREEEVRQAEAAAAVARAYRDAAAQALKDARMLVGQQQTLDLQIAQAQGQLAVAEEQLRAAVAEKDAMEVARRKYDEGLEHVDNLRQDWGNRLIRPLGGVPVDALGEKVRDSLKGQWGDEHYNRVAGSRIGELSEGDYAAVRDTLARQFIPSTYSPIPNQYWLAWVGVNSAGAAYDGAAELLADLQAERRSPAALIARANAAQAALQSAEAAVAEAEARLRDLRAGPTKEQIAALEAQVAAAEADVLAVQTQIDKLTLYAPAGGVVMEQAVHAGELALPGATLITLANLDEVSLVVFVPEDRLNFVRLGQAVEVTVDSFPGRAFGGEVVHIRDRAEFIPTRVQTQEDRVSLVFAVKIRLPNPDHALKPGMPADARLAAP